MKATIEVISGREGTFKVTCTTSGGKTFTMDVEGPGYSIEQQGQMRVEAVGEPHRIGNDTYSATTSVISGGCNGDTYQCTASNGAAPDQSHNVTLQGRKYDYLYYQELFSRTVASDPVITSLNQTSSTSVRVEWSQPPGGATVTGYVVHYSDGDTDRNESVPASSTNSLITGLTINITYYISVEATSEHLSGVLEFNVTFIPQPTVAFTTQPTEMTTTSGSVYFKLFFVL